MYKDIEAYGIVGDLRTVALVGDDGSIDFMCWPEFDSPSIFAGLLDDEQGGYFKISPLLDQGVSKQIYLPDTNILFTRFLSNAGVAEIMDFMPTGRPDLKHMLVRKVKTIRGQIKYQVVCNPKFNYGQSRHQVHLHPNGALFESKDGLEIFLRTEVPLTIHEDGYVYGEFTLRTNDVANFVWERYRKNSPTSTDEDIEQALQTTIAFWRRWVKNSHYQGRWRETVNRSALVLKLLMSQKYGSMAASPTFGLPEVIGGPRNWDYRYTWVRDTCFSLNVLMRLGYMEEAGAFMRWIEDRCCEPAQDHLQVMYGLDGRKDLPERTLSHWKGYRNSHPVHVGNAASRQIQWDIYGELMQSVYFYNQYQPISYHFFNSLVGLLDWLGKHWQEPDRGIWETRGGNQQFLYSKVMCWVAFERAIKLAIERSFPAPLGQWRRLRDTINREILRDYWNPDQKAFTQFKGSQALDASSLIMPMIGFIDAKDPLWLSTLQAIERQLVDDSHVYRYRVHLAADDGLPGEEGTFCMCTFWYVENLARCGRLDEARFNFEKMLGYANPLGLFSEELGSRGDGLGNYPQAFTHLSLISAAFDLNERLDAAKKD